MAKQAEDNLTIDIETIAPGKRKPGRPNSGKAMTSAERQRASRKRRKDERFDGWPSRQISVMLAPKANEALSMMAKYCDMSLADVLDRVLISYYAIFHKKNDAEFLKDIKDEFRKFKL